MKKDDVTCHECGAGFQRLELISEPGTTGEYHCPVCKQALESFDGGKLILLSTVGPAFTQTITPELAS